MKIKQIGLKELEPLSFSDAKAMVVMLGPAAHAPNWSPSVGFAAYPATPLHVLFASMPARQRQTFLATMDAVWPRPQRNQKKPHGIHGNQQWYEGHAIDDWNDAWAAALCAASQTKESNHD